MNPNEIIAIVIFIAVMVAIISEKIHRATAAVAGAVLLLVTQVLTVDTAWRTSTSAPSACWSV